MKEITLKNGQITIVDDEDFEWLSKYRWNISKIKYARGYVNGKVESMHRLILGLTDPKILVDHINSDGLDNRRSNLRTCTSQENLRNMRKHRGKSKYRGVSWCTQANRWRVSLTISGKRTYHGFYEDEEEAARLFDSLIKDVHGEFASLNFPDDPVALPEGQTDTLEPFQSWEPISPSSYDGTIDITMEINKDYGTRTK
jgi:hypothetical protein